jgi:hypothetical protein
MSTMLSRLNHLSAVEDGNRDNLQRAREEHEQEQQLYLRQGGDHLREMAEQIRVLEEQIRQKDERLRQLNWTGIEKQTLLPLVQQLADQIEYGTRRLAGERADWMPGPVQSSSGDGLIDILDEILTIIRGNDLPNITAWNMELMKPKLASIRYNIYLDYWYSAEPKTMEKEEHDYSPEEYPQCADWAPAIALFKIQHPTLRWAQLSSLYRTICEICDVDWR